MSNEFKAPQDKPSIGSIIFTVILIVLVYLLFRENGIVYNQNNLDLSYLLLPVILFLSAILIRKIFFFCLTGAYVKFLGDSFLLVVLALSLFLFFTINRSPVPQDYHPIGFSVLLSTLIFTGYRFASFFLARQLVLRVSIHAAVFFLLGLIIRNTMLVFTRSGIIYLEPGGELLRISAADLIFWGFSLLSLSLLFSLLSMSGNYYLTLVGSWFGVSLFAKFVFFLLVAFYFMDVRLYLEKFNINLLALEWMLLVATCLILFLLISKSVRAVSAKVTYARWHKHRQDLVINAGDDLLKVASYVDNFVLESDKKRLLIFIIGEALQMRLSMEQVKGIIGQLLDYRDESMPGLITRYESKLFPERNRSRRKQVLEETVAKFEHAGGGKE